ncbi:ran-binding protein M homolog [Mercurialis annua]|uniref:ran-binding protein M homolog n=1 Tax=Mercurialis annua TaxID=3986 RepID=UPI00215DF815|nr:ran-binding protein M homolog [Mercurialis annua]
MSTTNSIVATTSNGGTTTANNHHHQQQHQDPATYFLNLARQQSSSSSGSFASSSSSSMMMGDEDEREEEPTELNTINSSGGFLVISTDKLSVKYTNVNLHGHDVGAVQANKPAPVKRLVYYFEIYVRNSGAKGQIAIGFTNEGFKMRRQPGWETNSCGYHGDDGCLYRGQGKGESFGPTFTAKDTVGTGINYASQEIFFTKNGVLVGAIHKDIKGPLFPTVAVHSLNEEIEVNFGQKYFAFDLKEYEAQERMKQQIEIENMSLPPNVSYGLVRSYLLHYGYEETLNSFDLASQSTVPPIKVVSENGFDERDIMYALNQRRTLRQLIRNGDIDAAISKLHDWYPQIVQDERSAMCFLLHCQKFIEFVRGGALEEAVKYGRIELAKFFELPGFNDLVQDCVALLAYEQPQESSVGYLLEDSQREIVADTVNAMILSTNPNMSNFQGCLRSYLERLLRQLTVCCLERRSLNGDQGEAFHLHRVLNSSKKTKC